jgi:hypothetical protein
LDKSGNRSTILSHSFLICFFSIEIPYHIPYNEIENRKAKTCPKHHWAGLLFVHSHSFYEVLGNFAICMAVSSQLSVIWPLRTSWRIVTARLRTSFKALCATWSNSAPTAWYSVPSVYAFLDIHPVSEYHTL